MSDKPDMKKLAAFADGELQGQEARELLARMASDPSLARWVLQQQELRREAARVLVQATPPTPTALQSRVEALLATPAAATPVIAKADPATGVLARFTRVFVPTAVAAALLLVSLLTYHLSTTGQSPPPTSFQATAMPVVNSDSLHRFTGRHRRCSKDPALLLEQNRILATSLQELPARLSKFLGERPTPSLDLSALGYEFLGAGRCGIPGSGSVHLLYRAANQPPSASADPGAPETPALSLWLRPFDPDGSLHLEPGKIYSLDEEGTCGPLLVWRDQTMVYYLTGDGQGNVRHAADALRHSGTP